MSNVGAATGAPVRVVAPVEAQEQHAGPAASSPSGPGEPAPRLDPIDRWAALYQRARLWKRRARKVAAEAVAGGNQAAIRAALARQRRARHWEAFCRERYLRAVFVRYC